jgi:GT2 family glycosyltransferase
VKFLPENKGISGNSNEALSLASGEFVALLDHDDELAAFALYEVVKALNQNPETDFIYSDEDKLTARGERITPSFKPDWSPDLFLSWMYTCHLGVYRKRLIDEIGGFRPAYDGSQDHDLVLRLVEKTQRIRHLPKVLYHWRATPQSAASGIQAKPYAHVAAKKAIEDYLRRNCIEAEVLDGACAGLYRVRRRIIGSPLVSIIVPTRDQLKFLRRCIDSVLKKTSYDNYEIIVVNNQSQETETISYLEEIRKHPGIRVLEYDRPFNFSAVSNLAVSQCRGEHILLLNDDTEVVAGEWLSAMLEHSQRREVGAVGAKLFFPDGTIQHCGVIIGLGGAARHAFYRSVDLLGRASAIGNYSAVTAACMMLRKEVFHEVGGFDENLAVLYNDVDLCLRIRNRGYLIVYTPYAVLRHHESRSRPRGGEFFDRYPRDTSYFKDKWRATIDSGDPYYNPNLTLDRSDFSLRV